MRRELQQAESLLRSERYQDVVELSQALLIEDPQDLDALATIGIAFTEMGEHEKALKALNYHNTLSGQNADVHEAKGCALYRLGDYEKAEKSFRRALALEPNHASALRNTGVLLVQQGEHQEGYAMLERSFALNREDYRTLYALAYAETTVHRYKAAAARLHELLEKDLPESFKKLAEMSLERLSAVL